MSGTELHIFSPSNIKEWSDTLQSIRKSPEAFNEFINTKQWKVENNYTYEDYLTDWKLQESQNGKIEQLVTLFMSSHIKHEYLEPGIRLSNMLLRGVWFPVKESAIPQHESLLKIFRQAFFANDFVFDFQRMEFEQWANKLKQRGFTLKLIREVFLLNQWTNSYWQINKKYIDDFPLWIIRGYEYFVGYLTGVEFKEISTEPDGFLGLYRKCVELGNEPEAWQLEDLDKLIEARYRSIEFGDKSICIAIDDD